mgnify:CR=1 FL=1
MNAACAAWAGAVACNGGSAAGPLVGGAPLNEEFGKAIGADAYCRDAGIAVETAKTLIAARRAAR